MCLLYHWILLLIVLVTCSISSPSLFLAKKETIIFSSPAKLATEENL